MLLRSNDYVFYPLLMIAAAAMIGVPLVMTASDRFGAAEDIRENGITISGERLQFLAAGEGLTFEFLQDADGQMFARVSANAERGAAYISPSAGVFDSLRPYEIEAIAGYDLEVSYTLATPAGGAAERVDLAYFQDGIGQSAWVPQVLADGRTEYVITVAPPVCEPSFAFVGLWPEFSENANRVDLYEIRIRPGQPAQCMSEAD
jgi:hypothetical protein